LSANKKRLIATQFIINCVVATKPLHPTNKTIGHQLKQAVRTQCDEVPS